MLNLAVDIGNTLTKIAVFENDDLIEAKQYDRVEVSDVEAILEKYNISGAIISSVKQNQEAWQIMLAAKFKVTAFNGFVKAGINNHYKTPQTLGADRWAAVIGAHHLYPTQNNIIIGGGTCITYDFV
ncbi:MAG: type III pantothenate kinase, partial [Pedobacter sp.]